ncbi:flagellar protein FliS [Sulfobacillus thermosulfidooxidans]|uniref:flagellar protein FliS n=1 Tax=Sulfobacillus thermosulfidooxidans TaxID=28034 RepID=UPI00041DB0C3|nr:flagellar protein FliS [Sulfobacillus thermosulfidooxidans]
MDLNAPLNAYQQSQVLSDNPDYLGRELYRAVYRDLLGMKTALEQRKWDHLVNLGSHAQLIISALHDVSDTSSDAGRAFKTVQRGLWQYLNDVMRLHDATKLEEVINMVSDLIHQLDKRLKVSQTHEPARLGWSG